MPPSIPPAKGSDPEDVAWALQTADALWRRSERTDALVWLRRAVQAAGEADDPERAFALADAAAELTEQLGVSSEELAAAIIRRPSGPPPPPRVHPDASGSIDVSLDEEGVPQLRTSFPPGAGAEIDDLLGGAGPVASEAVAPLAAPPPPPIPRAVAAESPAPPKAAPPPIPRVAESPSPPKAAPPRPPPLPPRVKKLPPARLPPPPPSSPESLAEPLSLSDPGVVVTSLPASSSEPDAPASSVSSRPIPLPRGALFEDSTPFLPSTTDSDENEALAVSSRSGEHLAQGFDSLVRRPSNSALRAATPASEPAASFTLPAPPQFTEPPPEIRELEEEAPAPEPAPAVSSIALDAEAFADIPDEARDAFAAAGTVHELARDEEVPAAALCYVLEGEVRVSSAVVDAAGLVMKPGEVLRARGTIEANLPLRLSAHSDNAKVATWAAHSVEDAFAACPWVEGDLRGTANRTLAICGATIGPLGERLDEAIFLDAMARFEVMVLLPDEVFIEQGSPLPGLCIVGVGEILGAGAHGPGDFVFPEGVLTLAPSPNTFKAGPEGALILTASRAAAQELLVTCPPLLEILAGM